MTSPRGRTAAAVAALLAAATPVLAAPADLFYERTVMTAAGHRCGLFDAAVSAALEAARIQARSAALRSGAAIEALAATEQRARAKAAGADCASPDLALAAGRVRTAFEGYSKLLRMTWPGDLSEWKADRSLSRDRPIWRLSQTARFGADQMTFGLGGRDGAKVLLAAVSFADDARPYSARLVMRDPARAPQPYLNRRGGGGPIPLSARVPPADASRMFVAEASSPASERLRPAGTETGWLYRFPAPAARTLASLDPREAIMVEFLFSGRGGDQVRRAYIEVGDFAAGRAFIDVVQR